MQENVIGEILDVLSKLNEQQDLWKFYDLGRVAENKSRSTNNIRVYLTEKTPEMFGEGKDYEKEFKVKFEDDLGNEEEVAVNATTAITATWLPMGDRFENAPDVRVGERVFIYRYADMDEYFWIPTNLDKHLRRLETMTLLISADPDGLSNEPRNLENSYVLKISSHDRVIAIKTTKLNGEPFAYDLEWDLAEGILTIQDDVGNVFQLNSKLTLIHLQNKDGTFVKLDKENISAYAPDSINIEAVEDIMMKCKRLKIDASESITERTDVYSVEATTSYSVKSNYGKFDIPNVDFTGNINVKSKATMGSAQSKGEMKVDGPSTFSAPMKAAGIESSATVKGPSGSI